MCENEKTGRKVKIEGEAFDRLKAKRALVEAADKEADEIRERAHKQYWDAIHDEVPELDRDTNYSIDYAHEDLGFFIVKEKAGCEGIKGVIGALIAKATLSD